MCFGNRDLQVEDILSDQDQWFAYTEWLRARGLDSLPPYGVKSSVAEVSAESHLRDNELEGHVSSRPEPPAPSKVETPKTVDKPMTGKAVGFAISSTLSPEEEQLWTNMLQATGLSSDQYRIFALDAVTDLNFEFIIETQQLKQLILFADDDSTFLPTSLRPLKRAQRITNQTSTGYRYTMFKLPSLRGILTNPQLKRPVWNALKRYVID